MTLGNICSYLFTYLYLPNALLPSDLMSEGIAK